MFSQEEKKVIVDAINGGMNIDVISNELGISKEELQQYVDEFSEPKVVEVKKVEVKHTAEELPKKSVVEHSAKQTRKKPVAKSTNVNKFAPKSNIDKMRVIRENYKKMYSMKNDKTMNNLEIKAKEPTKTEIKKIDAIIKKVEGIMNDISNKKKPSEKRKCADEVLATLGDYYDIPCNLARAERMSKLILSRNLNDLKISKVDSIDDKIRVSRVAINRKLSEIVETEAAKTDDIKKMSELERKITYNMEKVDPSLVSIKSKIQKKADILRTKNIEASKFTSISDEVKSITRDIITGNADIDDIKQRIDNEAEELLAKNPTRGYFTLNKDQYREQIFMKIRLLLSERADEFVIDSPHVAIDRLTMVNNNKNFYGNLKTVVENFTSRGEFEKAKDICSEYVVTKSLDYEEPEKSKYARSVRKTVVGSEIGNMVVSQIKKPMMNDDKFMDLLEERLEKSGVNKNFIALGKSQDGLKRINLSDVWYETQKTK